MNTKQVIVMRRDLKMRRGKEIAQGSHASMVFLTRRIQQLSDKLPEDFIKYGDFDLRGYLDLTPQMKDWIEGSFAKICVRVNSEEELDEVYNKAKEAGLEVHMITDSGRTEFGGVPTKTALAIGPDYIEKIDPITGHLELL